MIGEVLGSYRVDAQIGEGGMGVVYSATHELLGSKAAVKLLLPELSSNEQIVERFFNEAKAAAMTNHPGLITVFDFGYHESGSAYIVMEFLEGESLAARLKRPGLSNEFIVEFMRQVALALQSAHDHQIVHRDLKPDNLFLCPDPALPLGLRVKILDFGIAKLAGDVSSSVKTRTGSMMGTPTYMAPEQCRGAGRVDHRADIYAMGCILFEMLAGRPPFRAEGVGEILGKHMYEAPPELRSLRPDVNQGMAMVVDRAIEKKSENRQQSVRELANDLAQAIGLDIRASTAPLPGTPAQGVALLPEDMSAPTVSLQAEKNAESAGESSASKPTLKASGSALSDSKPAFSSTTLGSAVAAAPTSSDEGSRRGLLFAAIGLLFVAGVGTALVLRPNSDSEKPVAVAAVVAPDAAVAASVPDAAIQEALPPAVIVPTEVLLTIESEPPGAFVYRALDGVRLGRTPYEVTMQPVEGEVVFVLKLKGYKEAQVELPANKTHLERVVLESTRNVKPKNKRPTPKRPEGQALDPFAVKRNK